MDGKIKRVAPLPSLRSKRPVCTLLFESAAPALRDSSASLEASFSLFSMLRAPSLLGQSLPLLRGRCLFYATPRCRRSDACGAWFRCQSLCHVA